MPDNTGDGVTVESGSGVTAGTSGAGSTGETASDVIRALKKRAQEAETKLAEFAAKEEAARQEALKKAGNYDTLAAELNAKLTAAEQRAEALAVKAAEYEAQQTAAREAQIASLPEAHRGIASALPADKLAEYAALVTGQKLAPAVVRPAAPGVPSGATGKATPEEVRANAGKPGWLKENWHRVAQ